MLHRDAKPTDVARMLGVTPWKVRQLIRLGILRAYNINIGGKVPAYRIPASEVERMRAELYRIHDNVIKQRLSVDPSPTR